MLFGIAFALAGAIDKQLYALLTKHLGDLK